MLKSSMKSQFFNEPLPFSDYFILELVNILGVEWLDFYYIVFYLLVSFALGGWVVAFYIKYKWDQEIRQKEESEL